MSKQIGEEEYRDQLRREEIAFRRQTGSHSVQAPMFHDLDGEMEILKKELQFSAKVRELYLYYFNKEKNKNSSLSQKLRLRNMFITVYHELKKETADWESHMDLFSRKSKFVSEDIKKLMELTWRVNRHRGVMRDILAELAYECTDLYDDKAKANFAAYAI